jgi:hypothetical protein
MTVEQQVLEKLRELPPQKQKEALASVSRGCFLMAVVLDTHGVSGITPIQISSRLLPV